jgi:lipopolysaccharide cholinephosphotransferase
MQEDIMYQEYEPAILEKLQQIELSMLKDFHHLCEKHGIDYFLCGGSLLGAVRHQGFIPWDDDIDIGMTREHYEHFLEVAGKEEGSGYALINMRRNPKFPCMFTKWYKKDTRFQDKDAVEAGYEAGIALDIFCFDNIHEDPRKLRKQAMRAWSNGKLLILCSISNPTVLMSGVKGALIAVVSKVGYHTLQILGISPRYFYKKAEHAARCCEKKDTKWTGYLFDCNPYSNCMKRTDIYPTRKMIFEDILVRVPHNPKAYLKIQYGAGYMTLPPVEQRHNHPPVVLDFGQE